MRAGFIIGVVALALAAACSRPPETPRHSQARLIVEPGTIPPGGETRLGIEFQIEPGWHIYWQNPGDSGEPPRVQWQTAEGAEYAPLEWPTPVRLLSGAGTDYGYGGAAVLLSRVRVPDTAKAGALWPIGGHLRWLECREMCIPQRAELNASLKIGPAGPAEARAQALLDAAAARIPRPAPPDLRLAAALASGTIQLEIGPGCSWSKAEFFPAERGQIDNDAPQALERRSSACLLELKKSDYLKGAAPRLNGVMVLDGQEAYRIDLPLRNSAKNSRNP
jgi:thiol:disulfide interchange protein DsbD